MTTPVIVAPDCQSAPPSSLTPVNMDDCPPAAAYCAASACGDHTMLPAIVGHRGARGEAPENTLVSFHRAVAAGVPEIELDLRLSSDRQLFVLHDVDLERTTGRRGAAQRKTLAAVTAMDARHAIAGWPTPCPIPSLAQVL